MVNPERPVPGDLPLFQYEGRQNEISPSLTSWQNRGVCVGRRVPNNVGTNYQWKRIYKIGDSFVLLKNEN